MLGTKFFISSDGHNELGKTSFATFAKRCSISTPWCTSHKLNHLVMQDFLKLTIRQGTSGSFTLFEKVLLKEIVYY